MKGRHRCRCCMYSHCLKRCIAMGSLLIVASGSHRLGGEGEGDAALGTLLQGMVRRHSVYSTKHSINHQKLDDLEESSR